MSESKDKKPSNAPLPPKLEASKPAPEPVPSTRPTEQEYESLQLECEQLRERMQYERQRSQGLQKDLEAAEEVQALLAAGIDPKWTDSVIRGLFAEADIKEGILGACMAVLEGERKKAVLEAEAQEQQGQSAQATIGAARRLRDVQDSIVKIYKEAKGLGEMDTSPKRASRY